MLMKLKGWNKFVIFFPTPTTKKCAGQIKVFAEPFKMCCYLKSVDVTASHCRANSERRVAEASEKVLLFWLL